MKKILYSVMAIAALTFSFTSLTSCEDVPAPYEIPGEDTPDTPDTPGEETVTIFSETFGNTDVSSKPTVDKYTGWNKSGVGATDVTYSGEKTSVRSSGLKNTGAYDNASGPNVIFFGTAPATFVINNISLASNQTKLKLTFGASSSIKNDDNSYNNTFDTSKFTVSVSADGTKWTDITYEKNNGDEANPYWICATSNFTLKKATSKLYIKFTANVSSAIRLDDVTLATGEGGQEVDLENGTSIPTTPDTPIADKGTESNPYTIAEVLEVMKSGNFPSSEVCIKGKISNVTYFDETHKSLTYYLSDDGTKDDFMVYSGKGLNGADFTSKSDLEVGKTVVVKGTLKVYKKGTETIYEFNYSSKILSIN